MPLLTTWTQIAAFIGKTVERADLDFKNQQPHPTDFELAKDIAALANGLGGTVVVGAATQGKYLCTGLPGVPVQDAIVLAARYERAAGDRCRPRAWLDCAIIHLPTDVTKAVLTVNVAAAPAAPLGIDLRETSDAQTWKFPLRTTSQTVWLSPDQFGAFEQMTGRRSGALLASIPLNERAMITLHRERSLSRGRGESLSGGARTHSGPLFGRLVDVDLRGNVAHFCLGEVENDGPLLDFRVPLDWVSTIWWDGQENRWRVLVDCVFQRGSGAWGVARVEE